MPSTTHGSAAEVALIIAGDIAGGAAALHLVVDAAAPGLPYDQAEALRFLARRLGELTQELAQELDHIEMAPIALLRKRGR